MKVFTVIGARPQFIKAAVLSRALQIVGKQKITEVIVHTGQHYDSNMSDVFFTELGIPKPNYNLGIGGGSHGQNTGRMLEKIEELLIIEQPDIVLVYGDTDSTLAGALAAAKLNIPVAHVEAGLRSFNMQMPEEVNRILTDQISQILFCPTDLAITNLEREGFNKKSVHMFQVGDVMQDSAVYYAPYAIKPKGFSLVDGFILATLHRAENTNNPERLAAIVTALNYLHHNVASVVLPLHPRTRKIIIEQGLTLDVHLIDPVGYLEMIWLLQHTGLVLTDSGGVQKEAFFFNKACVTMRDQTEWVELVEIGANTLVGAHTNKIIETVKLNLGRIVKDKDSLYGGGRAAEKMVQIILAYILGEL
ncbi:UDP-N-acetylglucosamine 2-epimerase (non-hydrolyzing) [Acinetobacter indicus]|uniref:non-hydrolyzing UDP-N-acetylglucosamine 2-epimerase n=1 Tax=Acinetobacter indicus TaxID=756892 RepID=UPI002578E9D7|nr:UDP-N-acetylglucosamine 2-epimerase (non-hydrolyzing) [Acinetobacter indicus]MDM1304706.1 UDP-N-acetylglucosamine 2-epimerase (non-hydrolyzing) [Acinetobacter indicus]